MQIQQLESNEYNYIDQMDINSTMVKQKGVLKYEKLNEIHKSDYQRLDLASDMHDTIYKLQKLEDQRREQAQNSINAKTKCRSNNMRINTYKRRIELKQAVLNEQNKYISNLEAALKEIQRGIKEFSNGYIFINEVLQSRNIVNDEEDVRIDNQRPEDIKPEDVRNELKQFQLQESSEDLDPRQPMINMRHNSQQNFQYDKNNNQLIYRNINDIPSDESFSNQSNSNIDHINKGIWNERERNKYQQFVDENRAILDIPELCYKQRIFVKMAQYIGTRTVKQCRCYHKQLINKQKKKIYRIGNGYSD